MSGIPEDYVIYYSVTLSTMMGVLIKFMLCFLIYITLPFIQLVYFISSEKKLTIHIVQMFQLLSQVFYNLKMFLMMDMLGVGDAININTNKNIRQVC